MAGEWEVGRRLGGRLFFLVTIASFLSFCSGESTGYRTCGVIGYRSSFSLPLLSFCQTCCGFLLSTVVCVLLLWASFSTLNFCSTNFSCSPSPQQALYFLFVSLLFLEP